MNRILLLIGAAALALGIAGCSNENPADPALDTENVITAGEKHHDGVAARYEVRVENLTPATGEGASQPFSPPVLATHDGRFRIFGPGRPAGAELAGVAEDALNGPLIDALNASRRVHAVTAGDGVILPGDSASFEIEAAGRARFLSGVFMLVNTNDAFGGLGGVRLPRHGSRTVLVRAWDAGTEHNSESADDIPGPCCGSPGMGEDEHLRIRPHRGIRGDGDLDPLLYGWAGAVARVTVTRLD